MRGEFWHLTHGKYTRGPSGGKQPIRALKSVTNASKFMICLKICESASKNVTLNDQIHSHLRWPKCGTYIRKRGSMWVRCAKPWWKPLQSEITFYITKE